VAVLAFLSVSDLAGGFGLASRPDGSALGMPVSLLNGWFPDFLVPGLLLAGLGVLCAVAAAGVLRGWRSDWVLAGCAAVGAMVWIVVEAMMIGLGHWLQPFYGTVGLLAGLLALPLLPRRT
jgi:zinc transporter ZupT